MLWTLIVLLVIFWILGLAFKVAAGAIHILLVVALVLFIVQLVTRHDEPRSSQSEDLIGSKDLKNLRILRM